MSTLRRSSSSYGGFADGIILRGMPLLTLYPGNVYWVDSNGGGGSRGTFVHPASSIVEAMGLCTSSNGDIIMCKPGHVEYISAAAGLVCDKADVAIVGTGTGSNQSKIIFDTADTADIDVTAANVSFINMWFVANFDNVDGAIDVSADGDYLTIQGCRVTATSTALDFEEFINLAVNADYFSFIDNDVHLIEGTDAESLVFTTGESLSMRVINNRIIMEASTSIFDIDATAITGGPMFMNNYMLNLTAAADYCVEIDAATVGFFVNERYACAGEAIPIAVTTASFFVNCLGSELANTSSLIFPKTATAWP
jgi:hypothetical protein